MAKVSDSLHLERRNGVYYYRRRVPDHAVAAIGTRTLKYSLGTSDKKQATKLRELEDLKWSARFASPPAHASEANERDCRRSLSGARAVRLVRDYVDLMDQRFRERYRQDPPVSGDQKQEMQVEAETDLTMLSDAGDGRGDELVSHISDELLRRAGVSLDGAPSYPQFLELIRRGLIELRRRRVARLGDNFDRSFFDALFDPLAPPTVTFGELADQYLAMQFEDAAINAIGPKWTDKVRANVTLLREIVGEGTLVASIDYDACLKARSILARTPSNRTKLYPGLSLDAAIAKAAADGKPMLSATTQGQYLDTLKNVLELATLKRLIPHNPAQSLRPLRRDATTAKEKRLPFTLDQLKAFFASDFYKACAPGASHVYAKPDRPWRFWLPLMCLFMGMRPNEVCQMLVSDVRQTKTGTWYVDVAASDDEDEEDLSPAKTKTLKTSASRRRIPIHPELVAIGFLDFVKERQKSSSTARLLAGLKPDKYGNLATYALRRFRETFLPEAIALQKRQSFYSFRHSFRDALRRIDAQPATLQALGGWSQGTLISDAYGDQSDPDYQFEFIAKVQFAGVDLAYLHRATEVTSPSGSEESEHVAN